MSCLSDPSCGCPPHVSFMQKEEERIRAASKRENKQRRMRERSFTKTHVRASDLEPDFIEDEVGVVFHSQEKVEGCA